MEGESTFGAPFGQGQADDPPTAPEPLESPTPDVSPAVDQDEPVSVEAAKAAAAKNTEDNPTYPVRSNVFPGVDLTETE